MTALHSPEESYWQYRSSPSAYPTLDQEVAVDVTIVGGGIAGLTAAYLLKQAGRTVAVLEKNLVGSGTTNKTTGKLSSQHGLTYADLYDRLGQATAQVYAEANQIAVEKIKQLIQQTNIDCGLTTADNYVFTAKADKVAEFQREAKIAAKLGLPATFETHTQLPFPVQAAVKFADQAYFNAQQYVLGLAQFVEGEGSYVFEHSEVRRFHDGVPATIKTDKGRVAAKDIIVATKVPAAPLVARAACAAYEHPHTSYIVAGKPEKNLQGMYISPDSDHYSILPIEDDGRPLLLIGGGHHTPGLRRRGPRYQKLAHYAEKYFGVRTISYQWRGMDYIAYDEVPLIGKVYPWSRHLYTATGFRKWGLSTSMVAGLILRDAILGKKNPWSATFTTGRLKPITSIPRSMAQALVR